jgi:hypothetical protein
MTKEERKEYNRLKKRSERRKFSLTINGRLLEIDGNELSKLNEILSIFDESEMRNMSNSDGATSILDIEIVKNGHAASNSDTPQTCENSSKTAISGENSARLAGIGEGGFRGVGSLKNNVRTNSTSNTYVNVNRSLNNSFKRPNDVRAVTLCAAEKQKTAKAKFPAAPPVFPDRLEMFRYARSRGYTEQFFHDWHDMNEDFGWTDKSGKRINNWRAALDGYVRARLACTKEIKQ